MMGQPATGNRQWRPGEQRPAERPLADRRLPVAGSRALVVGLGIEGVALTRFLAGRGARVTVNDARPAEQLAGRVAELGGVSFTAAFGSHDPALLGGVDAVYVSQGVPLSLPLVAEARRRGLPVGSIATLLFDICAGRIVGITGSAGKTTTTSLVSAIVARSGLPHILTGNIGAWPLEQLAAATPATLVVAEISHTQLQLTTRSPQVACVTNVTPNHLDQFTWEEYVDLKRNLVRHQTPRDIAVLNLDNATTRGFLRDTSAELLWFSLGDDLPGDGAFLRDGTVVWRHNGREERVIDAAEIPLHGRHNVENVLAATAVAGACRVPMAVVREAVREFRGVPHRLERVATRNGVTYVNDSIATAPERTLAGLRSFEEPVVLLLGGRDKNLPLAELAGECVRRCRAVLCFGEAGDLFAAALRAVFGAGGPVLERTGSLDEAVERAARLARPGDVVLLSPAGTSFDAYPNFERRGEHFRALVAHLTDSGTQEPVSLSSHHSGLRTQDSGLNTQPSPQEHPA
jgi:UDP-N-acetylmuramoylalanine--D-glutamate ligase